MNAVSDLTLRLLAAPLRPIAWIVLFALGALDCWQSRFHLEDDSTSYLELADAFAKADWRSGVNAHWSPLFPLWISLFLRVLRPAPGWEIPVVHLAHFGAWLIALAAFDYLLRTMIAGDFRSHAACLLGFGYAMLLWLKTSGFIGGLVEPNPDLFVLAACLVAAALLVRIRSGTAGWTTFAGLGAVLGLGYLAKTILFPLAFVFLAGALVAMRGQPQAVKRFVLAALVFVAIALPWIAALSSSKGRLTFGDAGKLNYAWYVNGVPKEIHWQGLPPGNGIPQHPTRRLLEGLPLFEFATPFRATYAPWYDPSYWYEGLEIRFHPRDQLRVLLHNLRQYWHWFLNEQAVLVLCVLALALAAPNWRVAARGVASQWVLILPAVAGYGLYALVLVHERYSGPFFVLFWLGLFCALGPLSAVTRLVAAALVIVVALRTGEAAAYQLLRRTPAVNWNWQVAEDLHRLGLRPGDPIATIGINMAPGWARLARLRIIAEIPTQILPGEPRDYRSAGERQQRRMVDAFASTGARIIVSGELPFDSPIPGWQSLGHTRLYTFTLGALQ